MKSCLVYEHGNFNTDILREVGDEISIRYITIELENLTSHPCVDDISSIFLPPFQIYGSPFIKPVPYLFLPGLFSGLILFKEECVFTGIPVCSVGAVLFNQFRAFAEPPVILRVMSTGLGSIIAQMLEQQVADEFLVIDFG